MKRNRKCMEMDENWQRNQRNSKILSGILVIGAGILILLKQTGMAIPHWILSWEMFLIALGTVMLVKHNFKKTGAYIVILIGAVFLINDIVPDFIEPKFIWPVLIIVFGISLIFKSSLTHSKKKQLETEASEFKTVDSENYVSSAAFFSGITKRVVTKNFKGATITSVFGGNEINLAQADFNNEATIDVTCVFGGVTLIVPSNWKIKSDLTSIFGGIEDQRPSVIQDLETQEKTLTLKGSSVFGGIEIHSYN